METPGLCSKLYLTLLSYVLCVLSNLVIGIGLLFLLVLKGSSKFWKVKARKPPECLQNELYGEHKYLQVNDLKLHYVENGNARKPLILFLHGFPDFWYSWRYQIKKFSKNYWTIALDLPGYGNSGNLKRTSDYHINNLVEIVAEFIRKLGAEKVILIGHDWGAMIGFRFICKHMNMVEKYVMIGTCSGENWMKLMTQTIEQLKMSWYVFMLRMPFLPEFLLRCWDLAIFDDRKSKNVTEEDVEALKFAFSQKDAFKGPLNYYRANSNYLFPGPPVQRPKNFSKGIYILGEHEKYISRKSGKLMAQEYENLEFKIVENAGHFVHTDAPEVLNSIVKKLLET